VYESKAVKIGREEVKKEKWSQDSFAAIYGGRYATSASRRGALSVASPRVAARSAPPPLSHVERAAFATDSRLRPFFYHDPT